MRLKGGRLGVEELYNAYIIVPFMGCGLVGVEEGAWLLVMFL